MATDAHGGAELTDDDLQGEIELVGDLVVAASASEGPLSDDEIDQVLGLTGVQEPVRRDDKHGAARRHLRRQDA